jgi:quercetin dioxygenase-like cupin family protein
MEFTSEGDVMDTTRQQADYTVRSLDDMERAFGGVFVRARASLGATAFGLQVIDLPPDSGDFYPEHDHLHDGQEEVIVVLAGSADLQTVDGVTAIGAGDFVRLAPETRRRFRSGTDGARLLAIGGVPGEAYSPAPNSVLGGPETFAESASSAMRPDGPPPQLRG